MKTSKALLFPLFLSIGCGLPPLAKAASYKDPVFAADRTGGELFWLFSQKPEYRKAARKSALAINPPYGESAYFSTDEETDPLLRQSRRLTGDNEAFISKKIRQAETSLVEINIFHEKWKDKKIGGGTGFFLLSKNKVVTNFHVISHLHSDRRVQIQNLQGDDLRFKRIIQLSALHDLAVLEVDGYKGPVLNLDPAPRQRHEYVFTAGFPIHPELKWLTLPAYYYEFRESFSPEDTLAEFPKYKPSVYDNKIWQEIFDDNKETGGNYVYDNKIWQGIFDTGTINLKGDKISPDTGASGGERPEWLKDRGKESFMAGFSGKKGLKWLKGANAEARNFRWHYFASGSGYLDSAGMSGGPVLTPEGKVIGVFSAALSNLFVAMRDKYIHELLLRKDLPLKKPEILIKEEMARLLQLAQDGNRFAQSEMGFCFKEGIGVESDVGEAYKWLLAAAKKGEALALQSLAYMVLSERHFFREEHREEARRQLKAAPAGNPLMDYMTGAFLSSEGLNEEAVKRLEPAAKSGFIAAQRELAAIYYSQDTAEGRRKALKWTLKAAALGNSVSQYEAGMFFYGGLGVKTDYTEAFKWLIAAARQNIIEAHEALMVLTQRMISEEEYYWRDTSSLNMEGLSLFTYASESLQRAASSRSYSRLTAPLSRVLRKDYKREESQLPESPPLFYSMSEEEHRALRERLSDEEAGRLDIYEAKSEDRPPAISFEQVRGGWEMAEAQYGRRTRAAHEDGPPEDIIRLIMQDE